MTAVVWYVQKGQIEEHAVPGKHLGRHIHFDSRSLLFAHQLSGAPPVSVLHDRLIPILDQGDAGSCTGNAETGALGTAPLYESLPAGHVALDEPEAVQLYSAAEVIDGDGPYPPQDNGSSGLSVCKAAKDAGLISGFTHCMSLADVLDALQAGPVITGINWYDCLPDGQRVLTSDLRWVPIEKIQVGDELVGFDEGIGMAARYRRAVVTDMGTKIAPVFEITTDQGTICSSGGHMFVGCHRKAAQKWVRADQIQPGDQLAYFMSPYGEDTSWEAGWLAGFFDGEGTVAGDYQLNFGQALGPTLDKAVRLLGAKGYETSVKQYRNPGTDERGIISRKPLANVYVAGGYHGALRFLGEMRPERLLASAHRLWEGRATRSRTSPPVTVQSVRCVGMEQVHAIGTSARTLVVEGFLSHNSFDWPSPSGNVVISPGASVRGGHEVLIRGVSVEDQLLHLDNSWGSSWGINGSFTMSYATYERLLSEQGDATVNVPLSQPAPVPVPVPPVPPAPFPAPDSDPDDVTFAGALHPWATMHHVGMNAAAAKAARVWMTAKGFTP
jgi:hypothetical protein